MSRYFIVTNKEEIENGYQLKDGLNIVNTKLNTNSKFTVKTGSGFNIMEKDDIPYFYENGIYIRKVTVPINDPKFVYVRIQKEYKIRAFRVNMMTLSKPYLLTDPQTFKLLDIEPPKIEWAAKNGYIDLYMDLFRENYTFDSLEIAAKYGHLEIFQFFTSKHSYDFLRAIGDKALISSVKNHHTEVAKCLIEHNVNIHSKDDYILKWCNKHNYTELKNYLIERGIDFSVFSQ